MQYHVDTQSYRAGRATAPTLASTVTAIADRRYVIELYECVYSRGPMARGCLDIRARYRREAESEYLDIPDAHTSRQALDRLRRLGDALEDGYRAGLRASDDVRSADTDPAPLDERRMVDEDGLALDGPAYADHGPAPWEGK